MPNASLAIFSVAIYRAPSARSLAPRGIWVVCVHKTDRRPRIKNTQIYRGVFLVGRHDSNMRDLRWSQTKALCQARARTLALSLALEWRARALRPRLARHAKQKMIWRGRERIAETEAIAGRFAWGNFSDWQTVSPKQAIAVRVAGFTAPDC